jgi:hypothetical protein
MLLTSSMTSVEPMLSSRRWISAASPRALAMICDMRG